MLSLPLNRQNLRVLRQQTLDDANWFQSVTKPLTGGGVSSRRYPSLLDQRQGARHCLDCGQG